MTTKQKIELITEDLSKSFAGFAGFQEAKGDVKNWSTAEMDDYIFKNFDSEVVIELEERAAITR